MTTVTLDETKFAVAKIEIEEVRVDRIATGVSVVGQIQANSDRQVEVRPAPRASSARSMPGLGQKVKRGDPLVILDSPEIGTARLNLRAKQRELSTARFEARWKSEIAANVALLIPELKEESTSAAVSRPTTKTHGATTPRARQSAGRELASTDARMIESNSPASNWDIPRHAACRRMPNSTSPATKSRRQAYLRRKDIVGEHPALVARHTREGIQAKLEAAIEQVRFDAAQEKRLADQEVRLAEAAVIDAAQRLRILGVSGGHPESARPCRPGQHDRSG